MSMLKGAESKTLIQLLINTPRVKQAVVSLQNITQNQALALCEVLLNILQGNISLSPKDTRSFARHKELLRKLCDPTLSAKNRTRLIRDSAQTLVRLLRLVKTKLSSVLPKL